RYSAHWREITTFVVMVHGRHREDDSIERLLCELLVDVKRRSDTKGHLMAGLLLEFRCDGLRGDLRRFHLSTSTSGRLTRVDETMSVSPLTAMVRKNRHIVSSGKDAMVHCVRIYTRKPSATRSPLRGVLHLSSDQSPPARKDPDGGKLSGRGQGREHES